MQFRSTSLRTLRDLCAFALKGTLQRKLNNSTKQQRLKRLKQLKQKNMKKILLYLIILIPILNLQAQTPPIELEPFAYYPSALGIENAGDSRLFIITKDGEIVIADTNGNIDPTPFLDISNKVSTISERGLLGLAFHPDYANNGYFFLNYTNNSGATVIARYNVSATDPDEADPNSEQIILTFNQPSSNHNGGDLSFGPDGYLYIPTGDGGGSGDTDNNAQNNQLFLGKVLRIDIDNGLPYTIPADNPFVGDANVLDEIWATGLRNPWRVSFDKLTGDLWIADVGQGAREEVNLQLANSTGGENYGWRCYEGNNTFNTSSNCPPMADLTFPVFEYDHNLPAGGYSITGGFVYRGSAYPSLYGHYICADYVSANLYTVVSDGNGGWNSQVYDDQAFGFQNHVATFGEDVNGELYVARLEGDIYKVTVPIQQAIVDVKVLLEGPYLSGGQMEAALDTLIPLTQPYSAAPYNYTGTETLTSVPNNMVDWVLLEARQGSPNMSGNRGTVTVETHAGVLLSDGSIVDVDGNPLTFNFLSANQEYYFCVRHRNHLDVLSASSVPFNNNMAYDFRFYPFQAFGTNQLKWDAVINYALMYGGDYNQTGDIQVTDYDEWRANPAQLYIYENIDGNLDGVVQVTDQDLWIINKAKLGSPEIQY